MRTIKFRGKRLNNGDWVYGSLTQNEAHNKNGEAFMVSYIAPSIPAASEGGFKLVKMDRVVPATVGQFTGLTDKNGEEIYEGDIVRHPWKDPIFGDLVETGEFVHSTICFNSGAFVVNYRLDGEYIYLQDFVRLKCLEVVGNIHDSPELLKGGKK